MIIDFHTHFCANKTDDPGKLLAAMDAAGVDSSVTWQTVTDENQHEAALISAKELDSRRIISFGSVMPASVYALEYVWKISDEGLKGMALSPGLQKFDLGDDRYFPVFDLARACRFVVIIDLCPAAGGGPRDIAKIMANFPGLEVVVSCLGNLRTANETLEIQAGKEGIYIDTAYCADVQPDKVFFKDIIRKHGAERILFGSGYPGSAPAQELAIIRSLDITEEEKALILGGNAARLLKL